MVTNNNFNGQLLSSISHPVGTYNFPLSIQQDYVGGNQPIYVGYAIPGSLISLPLWSIQKITYDGSGNTLSTAWSPNYSSFGDIWNDRAALSYS
jgi:hypothetical protein